MRNISGRVWACAAVVAGAVGVSGTAGRAATLVSDGFDDGTTGGYYLARGTTSVTVSVAPDATLGSGNALSVVSATTTQRPVARTFDTTTLAAGDSLSVAFDFRVSTDPVPASDRKFRFGLFNNGGTPVTANTSASATTDDDTGYLGELDTGTDTANTSYASLLGAPTAAGGGSLLGGTSVGLGATSSNAAFAIADNGPHHAVFTIARSGDNLAVSLDLDSVPRLTGNAVSGAASAPLTYAFNEFVIGENGVALGFVLDNVTATFTPAPPSPEPASLAALAGAGILLGRRRRA